MVAAYPTLGAEDRIRRAIEDRDALRRFTERLTSLIANDSFTDLPRYRLGWRSLWRAVPALHRLDEGPWRAVFVIYRAPPRVVALVFSKAPHRLDQRFDEVLARWNEEPPDPASITPNADGDDDPASGCTDERQPD